MLCLTVLDWGQFTTTPRPSESTHPTTQNISFIVRASLTLSPRPGAAPANNVRVILYDATGSSPQLL